MEGFLTSVMDGLEAAAKWVVNFLPMSPFRAISNASVAEFMGNIGWVIPVSEILAILQLWIPAVAVFYLYQAVLRFTKMIE